MLRILIGALFAFVTAFPHVSIAQVAKADSTAIATLIDDFKESIATKDSTRFYGLFFSKSVDFTGIMSKETEWSIKKNYAEFQGIAVSNHKGFIRDICKTEKKQAEKFYNLVISADGAIGAVSFDYTFYSGDKMIQWGNEKWNLAKDGEQWLITDVVYSIRFPSVEPCPFE